MNLDELSSYGQLQFKTDAIDLTEADSEFVVSYFINVYAAHIVFEFLCTNTVEALTLSNVSVMLEGVPIIKTIAAESIKYQQTASMCCVIERDRRSIFARFKATLLYSQEDDEQQEEWNLDYVVLGTKIWLQRTVVNKFDDVWESLHPCEFIVMTIPKVKTVAHAISRFEEVLGMEKLSEEKDRKKTTVKLSGKQPDGTLVLILGQFGLSNRNIVCRIAVASSSADLSEEILQSITF
jgi:coatomer protein complex subunit gamma